MSLLLRAHSTATSIHRAKLSQPRAGVILLAVVCAAMMLSAAMPAFATTYVVTPPNTTNCKGGIVYFSIQSAVTAAENANSSTTPTIYICPGVYAEQVVISKSMTLEGVSGNGLVGATAMGANDPTIVPPQPGGLVANASDLFNSNAIAAQILVAPPNATTAITVSVVNLIIDGSNNQAGGCTTDVVGIYYQNASGTINHVTTRFQLEGNTLSGCQGGLAIFAQAGYGGTLASAVTIENSNVHDYDKNGITVDGNKVTATVSGNYVVGAGATTVTAQNGIQLSRGALGKVENNIVTDDVYSNPPNCQANGNCYSASGILLYDSGGSSTTSITISGNTVSNTQGAIVTYGDSNGTADYNTISTNKITTSPGIEGVYFIDGIDMCSNNNTATSNTVMNSSGGGVHIDSSCTESTGLSGNNSTAASNTVNEACAGVLLGNNGGTATGTLSYNVSQTTYLGDACPAVGTGQAKKSAVRLKPSPRR